MHRVIETIQQIARHQVDQRCYANLGVVKSLHGANGDESYACTVELRESGIVLPRVPIATGVIGSAALPRENDLVLIIFAGGDLHAPVVAGRLYSEAVAPPANSPGEFVVILPGDETSSDKRMELRVTTPGDGTRSLKVTLEGDVTVSLTVDDEGIGLEAQDATFHLKQTSSSDGSAELKVGDSKVTIEQSGDVTIEATGTLKLKASKVEIQGDTTIKIAGQTIELN
jgi:uncharacterized protein involved in type VI secretion and phage assembly